ncbi:MAG TPA: hypothetical protein V6D25_23530 [Leptolyngbyaceae cyanobacterium]
MVTGNWSLVIGNGRKQLPSGFALPYGTLRERVRQFPTDGNPPTGMNSPISYYQLPLKLTILLSN